MTNYALPFVMRLSKHERIFSHDQRLCGENSSEKVTNVSGSSLGFQDCDLLEMPNTLLAWMQRTAGIDSQSTASKKSCEENMLVEKSGVFRTPLFSLNQNPSFDLARIDLAGPQLTILFGILDGYLGALFRVLDPLGALADGKFLFTALLTLNRDRFVVLTHNRGLEFFFLRHDVSRSQGQRQESCRDFLLEIHSPHPLSRV
jgi:hypothetical protein